MPTNALGKTSGQPDYSRIEARVRERLARLAEVIRKDGAPYPLTALLVNVWVEVVTSAGVTLEQVDAAFDKAERRFKFWPSPGEVLDLISDALKSADGEEAAQWFERVVADAVRRSPDIPDKHPLQISERVRRAINAAGGLDHLRECDCEKLQWARKGFIEAYVRYGQLRQDQFLLPDGEVKNLVAATAEANRLPAPAKSWDQLHQRGLDYAKQIKPPITELRPSNACVTKSVPIRVVDVEGRRRDLQAQKELIRAKYPLTGREAKVPV